MVSWFHGLKVQYGLQSMCKQTCKHLVALHIVYLNVFVDIWSISLIALYLQMNISKCDQEHRFLVCKNVLIYTILCSLVSKF